MIQHSLENCKMYSLLNNRKTSVSISNAGALALIEGEVAKTLEFIKVRFPNWNMVYNC